MEIASLEMKKERNMLFLSMFLTQSIDEWSILVSDSVMTGSSSSIGLLCTKNYQYWMDIEGDTGLFVILDEGSSGGGVILSGQPPRS